MTDSLHLNLTERNLTQLTWTECSLLNFKQPTAPLPPIDSIMRLMTVWRITGKIIRPAIIVTYAQL